MSTPQLTEAIARMRSTYAITPGAPLYRKEFGYYCLNEWYEQGLDRNADLKEVFQYHQPASYRFEDLGWCSAPFFPRFEEKVLEDRGEHELVQDYSGRSVLCFKGRRSGFMPEYVDHPVKDMATWVEKCKWRLQSDTPQRWANHEQAAATAVAASQQGLMITQRLIGGYMYLRSLIGPADLMYAFYDMPEVIHDAMTTWLALADAVIARNQQHVTLDEVFLAEDICYNHGALISPDMMKQFLFPYYQQLLSNIRSRQIDKSRRLHVQVDTDGDCSPVIQPYMDAIALDAMSPFEVASGCDVVKIGQAFPNLLIFGGIDKRVLAQGPAAIDAHLEYILPAMRKRGGYIPTCDHGVPAEVSLKNYLHYRKRCVELGG